MEEIIDLIATDSAAAEVTSKLKDVLFTKAAERIESQRPTIASSVFADSELEDESEVTSEPETTEEE